MKELNENEINEKLKKLDELLELIFELKRGYLKTIFPDLIDEEIDKKLMEWIAKRNP
ncbi:MAG: hypothetical protein QXP60_09200 [Nitrososphaerota archaeon]